MEPTLSAVLLTIALLPPASPVVLTHQPATSMPPSVTAAGGGSLRAAIARDAQLLSHLVTRETRTTEQAAKAAKQNWIQRHPSCFGAAVGFFAGFLIGFLPGDDAVFDDYAAAFNGAVLGGIGAGTGAILGWLGSRHK